jgi:hypothetical protein
MAASSNPFIGLPLATLQTLQTAYVAAVTALASNQSYSLNGRTLQRADLDKVMTALGQINGAIADAQGTSTNRTLVSFNGL